MQPRKHRRRAACGGRAGSAVRPAGFEYTASVRSTGRRAQEVELRKLRVSAEALTAELVTSKTVYTSAQVHAWAVLHGGTRLE